MTMEPDRLRSFVERLERLAEEKAGIASDMREVFKEATGAGFDGPALRKVLARRAMDPAKREELDSLIEVYEGSLSGAKQAAIQALRGGATVREAAAASGLSTGTISGLGAHVQKNGKTEHDAADVQKSEKIEHRPSTAGDGDAGSGSGTIPPPGPASSAAPVQDEAPAVETADKGSDSLHNTIRHPEPVYTPRVAPLAAVAAPAMPPIPTFLRRGVRL